MKSTENPKIEKTDGRRVKKPWLSELNRARTQDLTGQTFNALTVMYRVPNHGKRVMWHCKCTCGRELDVWAASLKKGQKSCGCMTKKILSACRTTHGGSHERLYEVWHNIKDRCYNPKHKSYPLYGGRGIGICKEWMDYQTFREWALLNGYNENAEFMQCTIDRIDNEKGYSPTNCRWTDMKVQCNNRSSNHKLTCRGKCQTLSEWSEETGIASDTIWRRLHRGWDTERALFTPLRRQKNQRGE